LTRYPIKGILDQLDVPEPKPLNWIGSSRKDLKSFPPNVRDLVGRALYDAQEGKKHPNTKVLHGFGGAGVLEVVAEFDGNAYRAAYTVRFATAVYVLHVFQKKATKGISTSKHDIDLIRARYRAAEEHYRDSSKEGKNDRAR
jgi:phage-related protein